MNYVTCLSPFLGSPDDLEAESIGLATETDEEFAKKGSTACTRATSWQGLILAYQLATSKEVVWEVVYNGEWRELFSKYKTSTHCADY